MKHLSSTVRPIAGRERAKHPSTGYDGRSRRAPAARGAVAVLASLALAALLAADARAAGFRLLEIPAGEGASLDVGLWYPSDEPVPREPNTEFELPVALDAPPGPSLGRLIVISHGYGGWYGGHADTAAALADAGFVVAAPSHAGNTWSDMSASTARWLLERPAQISRVIDHVLEKPPEGVRLDPDRVGVYGFSAGGYTALALAGGVLDLGAAVRHCRREPGEFVCREGMVDDLVRDGVGRLPGPAFGGDDRVRAAVIAAPGFGFAFTEDSLAGVDAAVQLWSGTLDTSVPSESNADRIAERLPVPVGTRHVALANHFAFMTVACREAFRRADPDEYEMVCRDAEGFDRHAFHEAMHREMIRFFVRELAVARDAGTGAEEVTAPGR